MEDDQVLFIEWNEQISISCRIHMEGFYLGLRSGPGAIPVSSLGRFQGGQWVWTAARGGTPGWWAAAQAGLTDVGPACGPPARGRAFKARRNDGSELLRGRAGRNLVPNHRGPAIETLSWSAIAYCCVVIVLSYALRGSTGFGAVTAMPLIGLAEPLKILVPAWTLLGIASSVAMVGRDRHFVAVRDVARTLPTSLIGIAIGLWVFKALDGRTLARGLGALVAAYGAYALWTTVRPPAVRQA